MRIQSFRMERWQSLHDHEVEVNLSESGVEPMSVSQLVEDPGQVEALLSMKLSYGHTSGSPELREQIASFYPGATRENVLVTCGGAEANYLAFWSLLEKGDRVAVEIPNYMQTVGLARAFAGGVEWFRLRRSREGAITRWSLDLESLNRAVTRKTRILLITNPHNPTGAILSEAEMDAIVCAARSGGDRLPALSAAAGIAGAGGEAQGGAFGADCGWGSVRAREAHPHRLRLASRVAAQGAVPHRSSSPRTLRKGGGPGRVKMS